MPRIPKPFRERPNTLKEMEDSLSAWNPALEEYNRRLREFDTDEEKRLIAQGRAGYSARLAPKRKQFNESLLPPCPITDEKPSRKVSGFSLSQAVTRIPGMPRTDRAILCVLCDHYNPKNKDVWPAVETIASLANCSERSVQGSLNRLDFAKYIAIKTGSDRKGDSRLRPDKPRAGGRAKTTHWYLNVNGIFKLAYPPHEPEPGPDGVSPFEPSPIKGATSTTKGATITRKGETATEKGAGVAPEQNIYPNSETTTTTTTTTTTAAEGRGCGNSSKPAAKTDVVAEEDSLPVNEQETRDAAAYLSKRFVEVTGRTLKLTKEHNKKLGEFVRDYDLDIVRGVWNEYLRRAPWNTETKWHAADFLQNFDSYFAHAQESATKALRPFLDKAGKPKTDAKLCAEAAWALSLHKKRWSLYMTIPVPTEKPESYAPFRTRAEQAVIDAHRSWRMPGGKPADFRFADTPLRNYRTVDAVYDRERKAWISWAEEGMRNDIAEYLATPNPSDTLVRDADQAVNYFHFSDGSSGLTDKQRQELTERCDRLPATPEEEGDDEDED